MSAPMKFDMESATPVSAGNPTPPDLAIQPRDHRFSRAELRERWWLNGDPVATAWYNTLSVVFPRGEAYFIASIKPYRAEVSPRLESEIRAFITQEVNHTREHAAFNRSVRKSGYDTSRIDKRVDDLLDIARKRSPAANLAATMALEHFTAIQAHVLLKNPEDFMGADGERTKLWLWHAIEEIEHKGVAFDTWLHATKDWSGWKRWFTRNLIMLIVSRNFVRDRFRDVSDLLEQDGLTGWRWKWRIAKYILGKPGALRRLIPGWLGFFKPGFHPWNQDDRHLIRKFDSAFSDANLPKVGQDADLSVEGAIAATAG